MAKVSGNKDRKKKKKKVSDVQDKKEHVKKRKETLTEERKWKEKVDKWRKVGWISPHISRQSTRVNDYYVGCVDLFSTLPLKWNE